jgi:DHA3 family macrolide efflux protein-like MFS transporter
VPDQRKTHADSDGQTTMFQQVSALSSNWKWPFFTVWTGQAFSLVGSALVRFALIWWLTERTGSATTLTGATLSSLLPFILLGPFVGALIDRWNRRWVMVVSDSIVALLTALLAILYWLEIVQVWHVYVVLFLRSLGEIFQQPAMRASTALMAPREQLTRVSGMNETLMGVVNIVSPPVGALLLEILDVQGTLAIDVVTAVMAIAPLLFISIPNPENGPASEGKTLIDKWRTVLTDTMAGLRFMWRWQGALTVIAVLALVRFFLAPTMSLLPLLVTEHFGGGALQLAWINSAHGFGFVMGGIILSVWGGFRRQTLTSLTGLFGVGLGTAAFGLVPGTALKMALVVMFLRTMMLPILRGPIFAVVQSSVPAEKQGRVFTMVISLTTLMTPLGLAIGGPVADTFGVRPLFVVAGAGCILMTVVWLLTPAALYLEETERTDGG